jgi:hypothetical protein
VSVPDAMIENGTTVPYAPARSSWKNRSFSQRAIAAAIRTTLTT